MNVLLHPAQTADHTFIIHSWLSTFGDSHWAKGLRADRQLRHYAKYLDPGATKPDAYWVLHRTAILDCLARPSTKTLVATFEEVPDEILGWACGVPNQVLHYVCVKPAYHGNGIAKQLCAAMGFEPGRDAMVSHQPTTGELPAGWRLREDLFFEGGK